MRAPFQVLVVPYRRVAGALEVAVLRRADHPVWQFVSGGGEAGEAPVDAARREAREEVALGDGTPLIRLDAIATVPACWFSAWPAWPAELLVVPEHAFAADAGPHELALSPEHDELRWLHYDAAIALLRFDSNKTALWELHERLFPSVRRKRAAFDTRHTGTCPCTP